MLYQLCAFAPQTTKSKIPSHFDCDVIRISDRLHCQDATTLRKTFVLNLNDLNNRSCEDNILVPANEVNFVDDIATTSDTEDMHREVLPLSPTSGDVANIWKELQELKALILNFASRQTDNATPGLNQSSTTSPLSLPLLCHQIPCHIWTL